MIVMHGSKGKKEQARSMVSVWSLPERDPSAQKGLWMTSRVRERKHCIGEPPRLRHPSLAKEGNFIYLHAILNVQSVPLTCHSP